MGNHNQKWRLYLWLFAFGSLIVLVVATVPVVQNYLTMQQGAADVKDKFNASIELSKAVIGVLGTYATAGGAIILFLNFRVAADSAKTARDQLTHTEKRFIQETELARLRLIADRFSNALELLGSEYQELRLGGIYTLEQIAKESPDYHWAIMELFTTFIREESLQERKSLHRDRQQKRNYAVEAEIQAMLTVIGRRNVEQDQGRRLDLRKVDLHNLTLLPNSNLAGADLSEANFQNADLEKVNLSKANLQKSNLIGTNLAGSKLEEANLSDANLTDAKLDEVNLTRANLTNANLERSSMVRANLEQATLSRSFLYNANFYEACLKETRFVGAYLRGAIFRKANFTDATFSQVHFFIQYPEWITRHFKTQEEWKEYENELCYCPSDPEEEPICYRPDFRDSNLKFEQIKDIQDAKEAIYDEKLRHQFGLPDPDPKLLRESVLKRKPAI